MSSVDGLLAAVDVAANGAASVWGRKGGGSERAAAEEERKTEDGKE